mmetsp:Transcript_22129/g.61565  ORF Transcript_22129/g.61565 Transcript_22129/m.61565 type:complete len:147 (+) Transcript_22129:143-583(+)
MHASVCIGMSAVAHVYDCVRVCLLISDDAAAAQFPNSSQKQHSCGMQSAYGHGTADYSAPRSYLDGMTRNHRDDGGWMQTPTCAHAMHDGTNDGVGNDAYHGEAAAESTLLYMQLMFPITVCYSLCIVVTTWAAQSQCDENPAIGT